MITNASHARLLPLVALLSSLTVSCGEAAGTFEDLAGTDWQSQGFGYVLEFEEADAFELYEVTPPLGSLSLVEGSLQSDADGVTRLISDESSEVADRGETLGTIRRSHGELRLRRPGTLDEIVFTRLADRPPILDQAPDTSPRGVLAYFERLVQSHHAFLQERIDALAIPTGLLPQGATWQSACAAAADEITPDMSRIELCNLLWGLLDPLGDTHTYLYDPDGDCEHDGWHPRTYATMFPGVPVREVRWRAARHRIRSGFAIVEDRFLDDRGLTSIAHGKIHYGVMRDQPILYVRIVSFSGYAREHGFNAQLRNLQEGLDEMARLYETEALRGVIIDLRDNDGGSDALGIEIASRFNHHPYTAYVEEARLDPDDPTSFTAPQTMRVPVSERPGFADAPVALLTCRLTISAGETFTMAMMERAADEQPVVRIGETTQGVYADVLSRLLPNGMAMGLPNERYLTTSGADYEIHGIPPDIEVPVWAPDDVEAGRDPALQRAIEEVLRLL